MSWAFVFGRFRFQAAPECPGGGRFRFKVKALLDLKHSLRPEILGTGDLKPETTGTELLID